VAEAYRDAIAAGVVPADLVLPGGLVGRQRIVRIAQERIEHIGLRRPDWLLECLSHLASILAHPEYLGYRSGRHARRVDFVRRVGTGRRLVQVGVKFIDLHNEAWVATALPLDEDYLTRRVRSATMWRVNRGP
jgi:hypothetical protein